jgi:hypothetical protein
MYILIMETEEVGVPVKARESPTPRATFSPVFGPTSAP